MGHSASDAIDKADGLVKENYSIHFHVFMPSDVLGMLNWIKENICPIKIDGPSMAPSSHEFHLLLEKG